jgi:hypothetical protein
MRGLNWIDVAQDRKKCQAVVNTVIKSGLHRPREFHD